MQLIPLSEEPSTTDASASATAGEALAGVVASIGAPDFGTRALAVLDRWVPACWFSVYRLFDHQPPTLYASGNLLGGDGHQEAWRAYGAALYRHDDTLEAVQACGRPGQRLLMHRHAREMAPRHREQVYRRHGLSERVSLLTLEPAGSLLAINLYRHQSQAAFRAHEIDAIGHASALLTACVLRHLGTDCPPDPLLTLTVRERAVCSRMLKGWTHDGIAADLGVSSATVKTYRNRAFDRLGIHHRNELFALMAGQLARTPRTPRTA